MPAWNGKKWWNAAVQHLVRSSVDLWPLLHAAAAVASETDAALIPQPDQLQGRLKKSNG
jgi:hypothetical protein